MSPSSHPSRVPRILEVLEELVSTVALQATHHASKRVRVGSASLGRLLLGPLRLGGLAGGGLPQVAHKGFATRAASRPGCCTKSAAAPVGRPSLAF